MTAQTQLHSYSEQQRVLEIATSAIQALINIFFFALEILFNIPGGTRRKGTGVRNANGGTFVSDLFLLFTLVGRITFPTIEDDIYYPKSEALS